MHLTLGTLLAAHGDLAGATAEYETAARLEPRLAAVAREGIAQLHAKATTLPSSQPAAR